MIAQSFGRSSGEFIPIKLCRMLRLKIQPLLLDGNINSLATIIHNCYDTFWVAGIKFVRMIMCLSFHNSNFMFEALQDIVEYSWTRIYLFRKNLNKNKQDKNDPRSFSFPLTFYQFDWIAARAFRHAIGDKHKGQFGQDFHKSLEKWEKLTWKSVQCLKDRDIFTQMTDKAAMAHSQLWDFDFEQNSFLVLLKYGAKDILF
ncbi:hypothetical protein RFI_18315 [Reticulomyxa filosa]|uniref:Telomerase reverse transcriptase n=1 Tax=Reticulomyxa filosa TaxID=46433 RepID=X6N0T8_RETFI|nr:hypothetical protein RFI_18315 [Reticulomyxa filosa]|eukprot:ETO18927.1 hypothetical protein RFI_18315 [Reticulomyxa filosa]